MKTLAIEITSKDKEAAEKANYAVCDSFKGSEAFFKDAVFVTGVDEGKDGTYGFRIYMDSVNMDDCDARIFEAHAEEF